MPTKKNKGFFNQSNRQKFLSFFKGSPKVVPKTQVEDLGDTPLLSDDDSETNISVRTIASNSSEVSESSSVASEVYGKSNSGSESPSVGSVYGGASEGLNAYRVPFKETKSLKQRQDKYRGTKAERDKRKQEFSNPYFSLDAEEIKMLQQVVKSIQGKVPKPEKGIYIENFKFEGREINVRYQIGENGEIQKIFRKRADLGLDGPSLSIIQTEAELDKERGLKRVKSDPDDGLVKSISIQPYFKGSSLFNKVLPIKQWLGFIKQSSIVLDGYLNQSPPFLHNDIWLENWLWDEEEQNAYLIDLGQATISEKTESGEIKYTSITEEKMNIRKSIMPPGSNNNSPLNEDINRYQFLIMIETILLPSINKYAYGDNGELKQEYSELVALIKLIQNTKEASDSVQREKLYNEVMKAIDSMLKNNDNILLQPICAGDLVKDKNKNLFVASFNGLNLSSKKESSQKGVAELANILITGKEGFEGEAAALTSEMAKNETHNPKLKSKYSNDEISLDLPDQALNLESIKESLNDLEGRLNLNDNQVKERFKQFNQYLACEISSMQSPVIWHSDHRNKTFFRNLNERPKSESERDLPTIQEEPVKKSSGKG